MIPTKEELKKIKLAATLSDELDQYVYLREDEKGRYIEYAFIDGAPHDNRCLSWYDKPHPKTLSSEPYNYTKEDIEKSIKRLHNVGELYELSEYTCGKENEEGEKRCCVGNPKKDCSYCKTWNYDEPIKCACWTLREPYVPKRVSIPIEKIIDLKFIFLVLK